MLQASNKIYLYFGIGNGQAREPASTVPVVSAQFCFLLLSVCCPPQFSRGEAPLRFAADIHELLTAELMVMILTTIEIKACSRHKN